MRRPECLIIAGPNGGGKTTVYKHLVSRGHFPPGLVAYINTDDNLTELRQRDPSASDLAAGRMSIVRINNSISNRQSFVFETTMTSRHSIRVIERARQAGFRVGLIFVLLNSVELHVARVAARVAQGGHFVPEQDIRRRYVAAQRNLGHALHLIDAGYVVDNSPAGSPRRLIAISGGKVTRLDDFNPHSSFDLELWHKLCDLEPPW